MMKLRKLLLVVLGLVFMPPFLSLSAGPMAAGMSPTTGDALFCVGENTSVSIDLSGISNLYGYQLKVHYNATLVSAVGAFDNSFFDVDNDGTVPPSWKGTCAAGVCPFAKSEVEDSAVTGSGTVATVTFTGLQAGEFDVTITEDILSDRDGTPIAHSTGSLHLKICGGPTAVTLTSFAAKPVEDGTLVEWETASELNSLGFNLFRAEGLGKLDEADYVQVNDALILSTGDPLLGDRYRFSDREVAPWLRTSYWLEEVEVGGATNLYGPANAFWPADGFYVPLILRR